VRKFSAVEEALLTLSRYHPSLVAGVVFAILFMGTTFFHVFQAARKGSMFLIPLIIGGFC
jgi:hypothetical protein